MQIVTPEFITGKKVLLRLDMDVPIENGKVSEDFRLRAGLDTLRLCLEYATQVIVIGHIGRPDGQIVEDLRVEPVKKWFEKQGFSAGFESRKLEILENLRFDSREEGMDEGYGKELSDLADSPRGEAGVYINEAFASYRPSVSTTILPKLLPHAAGLRFAEEVEMLTRVRESPKKPFVAIMGGAKVADKLPVIEVLAKTADAVLVGGKLVHELRTSPASPALPPNVLIGKLTGDGFDIAPETTQAWGNLISRAAMIIWNGPLGKFEDPKNDQTEKVAKMILESGAEVVIGGGDSIAALNQAGLLEKAEQKAFVSVGGGAMLKFLSDGTLPTTEVLS